MKRDSTIFSFMSKLADLCILNLAMLLFCIPIVTIGTSISTAYQIAIEDSLGDGGVFGTFMCKFKASFKNTIKIWLSALLIFFILYCDIFYWPFTPNTISLILRGILICFFITTALIIQYALVFIPYVKKFTFLRLISYCFTQSIRHIFSSSAVLLLSILPLIIFLFSPTLFITSLWLWLSFGFAMIIHGNAAIITRYWQISNTANK